METLNFKLKRTLYNIKYRCNNKKDKKYKYYGGRGIKCLLTFADLKYLWKRDNASILEKPSIHRKNNDGNYSRKNCKFIEMEDNRKRGKNGAFRRLLFILS